MIAKRIHRETAMNAPVPSPELLRSVRSGFVQQGTSLFRWCNEQGITRQYAAAVLTGKRNGPSAKKLLAFIIAAAELRKDAA
jgi:hypothetical protein